MQCKLLGFMLALSQAASGIAYAAGATSAVTSPSAAQTGAFAGKPSTDTKWTKGLTSGPNGPIPFIVVDQFGYPERAAKIAVIRAPQAGYDSNVRFTPGSTFAVVDRATGMTVKTGPPVAWNNGATDPNSGDKAWWFDFSDVTAPGTYTVVDTSNGIRSVEFEISGGVYRGVLKHALRMFFYQRAGFEKTKATAGAAWADGASHLGPRQDPETRSWLSKRDASQAKDLRGGWYDAGDFNKYTSWTARNIIVLLRAFDENPAAFGDDNGIAESGNGIPDVLDEVKWGLDWLKRMQNADGSLLCVQGLSEKSPPSSASGPSFFGPPTTSASLMGAAVFAYAAKIFSAQPGEAHEAYAQDLAGRAQKAWTWAAANPAQLYYNNDERRQPGSKGLASGQQEMNESERLFARVEAAIYLFEQTGESTYRQVVEANYNSVVSPHGPTQWEMDRIEALLYYAGLPGVSANIRQAILSKYIRNIIANPDQLAMVRTKSDPYLAPIKDHVWGSNQSKAAQARIYQLLARYGPSAGVASGVLSEAQAASLGYIHYIHGVNPLGLVYLTNMREAGAEHSANTIYHNWFAYGTRWQRTTATEPGPPPGYLVGGPNPSFALDSCCSAKPGTSGYLCYGAAAYSACKAGSYTPPIGQPPTKSYLQFNRGWPANSWQVTEPSTGYQASYIRVLSAFVN